MRALVTGGAGFIGSHLCDLLLSNGWHVDIMDDLSTGRTSNIQHAQKEFPDRLRLIVHCAADSRGIGSLVSRADAVFHLAAVVGVERVLQMPVMTIERNIGATANVLRWSARYKVPTVIASSSEVYGRSSKPLLSESDSAQIDPHVRWGYAAAKLVDEFTAMAHYGESQLPVVICRLFNTIGPRQIGRYGMVVPRFVDQALAGNPITVFGDGQQRRSFTWVGDVVRAMFELSQTPAAYGQIVNIGHLSDISILELAQMMCTISQGSTIEHVPMARAYRVDFQDIEHRVPDLTKIRQLIGYQPRFDLDDMIMAILKAKRSPAR